MAVVQDNSNWRKSEMDEWKQDGGRTGYSAHIREVMADMKAGPGTLNQKIETPPKRLCKLRRR